MEAPVLASEPLPETTPDRVVLLTLLTARVLAVVAMTTLPAPPRFFRIWSPSRRSVAPELTVVTEALNQRLSAVMRGVPELTLVLLVKVLLPPVTLTVPPASTTLPRKSLWSRCYRR